MIEVKKAMGGVVLSHTGPDDDRKDVDGSRIFLTLDDTKILIGDLIKAYGFPEEYKV